MMPETPRVYLVDDDPSVRRALSRLLGAEGHRVESFGSAEAFLDAHDPEARGCVLLDLDLPGMDGFGVQSSLCDGASARPVVFLTGHGSIPASVRAMKAGAVDFLVKPVEAAPLLAAVADALERDRAARAREHGRQDLDARLASLPPREREVMDLVVAGRLNKQIADDLGIAEKTTKVHRGRMMKKMGARTVADLVRIVTRHRG